DLFGSTSETSTEMRKYTRDLYARLEAETGQSTGLRPCGFIEVAADPDRLEEYRRVAAFNRYCGVDGHEISPRQILEGVPCTGVTRRRGAVTGVTTPAGPIAAEYVVNCAGMWARQLGAAAGVNIPLQAAEHYYL